MFRKNRNEEHRAKSSETTIDAFSPDVDQENLDVIEPVQSTTSKFLLSNGGSFVIKSKPSDKLFNIMQEVDVEELYLEYPALKEINRLDKIKSPLLYLSDQAEKEIKSHISWNKKTISNVNEQGGILIGKPFLVGHSILGIVECVIPAEVSRASSAYLEMGTDTWAKMLEIYDDKYKNEGLYVIGWFHTHPNSLSVFMSGTDMGTQRGFFNEDWHFSVVLNPHRRLIACFNSANADMCDFYPTDFVDR